MFRTLLRSFANLSTHSVTPTASSSRSIPSRIHFPAVTAPFSTTSIQAATLNQVTRGARKPMKRRGSATPSLSGCYQKKGVCSKVYTMSPRKPNSAVRKVVRCKLSNGKVVIAYIPGEGHNLQEHSVILLKGGRTQDLPGLKYKVVRGALDLAGVAGRAVSRSKYGTKKPKSP